MKMGRKVNLPDGFGERAYPTSGHVDKTPVEPEPAKFECVDGEPFAYPVGRNCEFRVQHGRCAAEVRSEGAPVVAQVFAVSEDRRDGEKMDP